MEQVNMSKIASLQAGLNRAAGRTASPAASPTAPDLPAAQPASVVRTPSRAGKVHIGAYLPGEFKKSLRLVQAQSGEDTQTLIARALNDLFRAHNVPVIDLD
jgi:hypothetical protein